MLEKAYADDPYNKISPDCLWLLCGILYYDLKDMKTYEDYMTKLAVNYYPEIPVVAQARQAFKGVVGEISIATESKGEIGVAVTAGKDATGQYWDCLAARLLPGKAPAVWVPPAFFLRPLELGCSADSIAQGMEQALP